MAGLDPKCALGPLGFAAHGILGGSWVVISGVESRLVCRIVTTLNPKPHLSSMYNYPRTSKYLTKLRRSNNSHLISSSGMTNVFLTRRRAGHA